MPGWDSFFVAQIGAAAALAGLIFVGISINLSKIIGMGNVVDRGLEALLLLLSVLVISSLLLIPRQPETLAGWETLIGGIVVITSILLVQLNGLRAVQSPWRREFVRWIVFTQLATIFYPIAGVALLVQGSDGVYWVVPAILLSFVIALLDAWVLLVEINR